MVVKQIHVWPNHIRVPHLDLVLIRPTTKPLAVASTPSPAWDSIPAPTTSKSTTGSGPTEPALCAPTLQPRWAHLTAPTARIGRMRPGHGGASGAGAGPWDGARRVGSVGGSASPAARPAECRGCGAHVLPRPVRVFVRDVRRVEHPPLRGSPDLVKLPLLALGVDGRTAPHRGSKGTAKVRPPRGGAAVEKHVNRG